MHRAGAVEPHDRADAQDRAEAIRVDAPVQRTNQPASRSTACARWVSSPASSTAGPSSTVTGLPAKSASPRCSSSGSPGSVVVPPTPSGSVSVNSVCRAVTAVGRITSQAMSSAPTAAAAVSLSDRTVTGSPSSFGLAK